MEMKKTMCFRTGFLLYEPEIKREVDVTDACAKESRSTRY